VRLLERVLDPKETSEIRKDAVGGVGHRNTASSRTDHDAPASGPVCRFGSELPSASPCGL
jgi:hypothetical protein